MHMRHRQQQLLHICQPEGYFNPYLHLLELLFSYLRQNKNRAYDTQMNSFTISQVMLRYAQ